MLILSLPLSAKHSSRTAVIVLMNFLTNPSTTLSFFFFLNEPAPPEFYPLPPPDALPIPRPRSGPRPRSCDGRSSPCTRGSRGRSCGRPRPWGGRRWVPRRWVDRSPSRASRPPRARPPRSEEHTSELQSQSNLVCRLLLEK